MAVRPAFFVTEKDLPFVEVKLIDFEWIPGMSKIQKQKCIDSLHSSIKVRNIKSILEISSKSRKTLGVNLSAFNLGFIQPKNGKFVCVESAFQGSKVFELGGPFPELYSKNAREAKKFFKEKELGKLVSFNFYGQSWPINPFTIFYDWVYLNSLHKNPKIAREALEYECFTDIEFNPKKSINCQAYSVALYVSLHQRGELENVLENRETYIQEMKKQQDWIDNTNYAKYHKNKLNLPD